MSAHIQLSYISADLMLDNEVGHAAAAAYVTEYATAAAALVSAMRWVPATTGVLRCTLYGHSILWDVKGDALHDHSDPNGYYELLAAGAREPKAFLTLAQVVAYTLFTNRRTT